jgi:hypothetical protein
MTATRLLCAISTSTFLFALAAIAQADSSLAVVSLVSDGQANCAIFRDKNDALSERMARKLADYLAVQAGSTPPILDAADLKSSDPHQTLIVIDGSKHQDLLAKINVRVKVPTDRSDAYALKVLKQGSHWIIGLAGTTPPGAKYATYRFMEEMQINEDNSAQITPMDVTASPFIQLRSVSLFNIWRCPVEIVRKCNLESWPAEKIQDSIDTYDAFGFNAVETHDRFHEDFLEAVYGVTRAQWREKVYALCDRAHADGMTVFFRLWGNAVEDPVTQLKGGYTPFGHSNLAPDIPSERQRWNVEIRDYASKNYASHIDHLIGHWADASGTHAGSHATIKDAVLLHNELVKAFRAINPKIDSTFNLWGMANPKPGRGWPGYVDYHSVADDPALPKDVAIAQTTRARSHLYSQDVTDGIIASGHPAAVWTWRRADTEVRFGDPGLRIRVHKMIGDYFHNLPESASKLAWHNIERNHHGLANDVNYYVCGKLMWDHHADVDQLLNKYCALVFGQTNAKAVAEAFDVIEMARDVEDQVSKQMINHPAEGAERARKALEAIEKVHLAPNHHSRLPSVTSPEEMLKELRGALTVIAENGRIMASDLPAIESLLKAGKTKPANAKIAALLPKVDRWFGTIDGGIEGLWLKETLEKMRNGAVTEKLGFQTINVSSIHKADSDKGVILSAKGKAPGFALLELDPPARGPIEFRFSFKSSEDARQHNAGIAFGPSTSPSELIRCHVFLGGPIIEISGGTSVRKRVDAPDLKIPGEHRCLVKIDPVKQTITFSVDGSAIDSTYQADQPISIYGYDIERTATQFSPIEVNAQ